MTTEHEIATYPGIDQPIPMTEDSLARVANFEEQALAVLDPPVHEIEPVTIQMTLAGITFTWPTERPHFAVVTAVTDGDTIRCTIDLDLKAALTDFPVRLAGCNAAEKSTEAGQFARANLITRLPVGTKIILTTVKDYKYGGEFIARVFLLDGTDLVADLIAGQWLAPWDGVGRGADHVPPWPRTVV